MNGMREIIECGTKGCKNTFERRWGMKTEPWFFSPLRCVDCCRKSFAEFLTELGKTLEE